MKDKKNSNEAGVIVLESVFGVIVSVVVMFFLLSLGFYLYQVVTVHAAANEIAEEVALVYKFRDISDASEISLNDVESIGRYRYLLHGASYDSMNESRASEFANVRLAKGALAQAQGTPSVTVERLADDVGRMHYEVTVSQNYEFMLTKLLTVFGMKDIGTIRATAYVESVDVSNYINTVKMVNYGLGKVTDGVPVLELIDKVLGLAQTVYDFF